MTVHSTQHTAQYPGPALLALHGAPVHPAAGHPAVHRPAPAPAPAQHVAAVHRGQGRVHLGGVQQPRLARLGQLQQLFTYNIKVKQQA